MSKQVASRFRRLRQEKVEEQNQDMEVRELRCGRRPSGPFLDGYVSLGPTLLFGLRPANTSSWLSQIIFSDSPTDASPLLLQILTPTALAQGIHQGTPSTHRSVNFKRNHSLRPDYAIIRMPREIDPSSSAKPRWPPARLSKSSRTYGDAYVSYLHAAPTALYSLRILSAPKNSLRRIHHWVVFHIDGLPVPQLGG